MKVFALIQTTTNYMSDDIQADVIDIYYDKSKAEEKIKDIINSSSNTTYKTDNTIDIEVYDEEFGIIESAHILFKIEEFEIQ